jgi:hypothetical protein
MKTTLTFLAGALVLAGTLLPDAARAQAVCFTDNFAFAWDMTLSSNFFTGTVDVGTVPVWYATGGRGTTTQTRRHHTFTAINPNLSDSPDCSDGAGETDWFTYNGLTGAFNGTGYPYNGTWVSSCGGSGTFSGLITVGACPAPRVTAPVPNSPAMAAAPLVGADARSSAEGYALTASPNPLSRGATISFTIPARADVRIVVYDGLGREVAVLVDEAREAGTHAVTFDASSLAAGTYLYQLVAGSYTEARPLVIVR